MAPKKTSTKAPVSPPTPAPAPAPVVAPEVVTEVVTEKVKRPRVKKTEVEPVPEVVSEAPVVSEAVVSERVVSEEQETVAVSDADILKADLAKQHHLVIQLSSQILELKALSKILDKRVERVLKNASKKGLKKTRIVNSSIPRKPTGFCRPVKISKELSDFLGKSEGAIMPRTDASRLVYNFIKSNEGENHSDARTAQINTLLNKNDDTPIKYCNLQTYLKPHFILLPEEESVVV
jgi:chromatin remodeling complex protein RSC6